MSRNVVTDATVVRLDYKMAMIDINDQLAQRDVEAIKFLCSDLIPISKMERIKTGLNIVQELQHMCLISQPDDILFLAELLFLIGRVDLLHKLNTCRDDVRAALTNTQLRHVSPYRILLHKLCQELTRENVADFLFLCVGFIPRCQQEYIKDPRDLFYVLERQRLVQSNRVQFLSSKLSEIRRQDLTQMVEEYCYNHAISYLEADDVACYFSRGDTGEGNPSSSLVPRGQDHLIGAGTQLGSNNVVSCNPARVLEPDDPFSQPSLQIGSSGASSVNDTSSPVDPCKLYDTERSTDDGLCFNLTVGNDQELLRRISSLSVRDSDDMPGYKMTSLPRGICLIINNENFFVRPGDSQSKKMPDRTGTNVDCRGLEDVFEQLNFEVQVENDLTRDQLMSCMKANSFDHSRYDCFVCCILTHGELGVVYGTDGRTVPIKDLMFFFTASCCPSLACKPKMFFVQACQGKEKQPGFQLSASDVVRDSPSLNPSIETIPIEADFLLGMSTVPGMVSFRSKSEGSWYITTLVRLLRQYAKKYDLLSILTRVNQVVAEATTRDAQDKQMPQPTHTLRKRVFLGGLH